MNHLLQLLLVLNILFLIFTDRREWTKTNRFFSWQLQISHTRTFSNDPNFFMKNFQWVNIPIFCFHDIWETVRHYLGYAFLSFKWFWWFKSRSISHSCSLWYYEENRFGWCCFWIWKRVRNKNSIYYNFHSVS